MRASVSSYTTSGLVHIGHRRERAALGLEEQAWEYPTVKFGACELIVFVRELGWSLHRVTCLSQRAAITQTSAKLYEIWTHTHTPNTHTHTHTQTGPQCSWHEKVNTSTKNSVIVHVFCRLFSSCQGFLYIDLLYQSHWP